MTPGLVFDDDDLLLPAVGQMAARIEALEAEVAQLRAAAGITYRHRLIIPEDEPGGIHPGVGWVAR